METPTIRTITPEEGVALAEKAYSRADDRNFAAFLLDHITDPVQPRNEAGRRRIHPVLVSTIIIGVLLSALFIYFSYWHLK